jgi:thiamine biosynthesis protein ThiS
MQIFLNGETKELFQETSLQNLIEDLDLKEKRIAIELNCSVIKRKDWPEVVLKAGDKLEIVHFVGGG